MVNEFLIAAVNRLSPLVARRTGRLAAALPFESAPPFAGAAPAAWLEDLKLFATGWLGGLVFFGTLIG
jgi:hypothetical protein